MSFIYLASPYSHEDPSVREERFQAVCKAAAYLMRKGHIVFSPIAHSHSIEVIGLQERRGGEFWQRQDIHLLRHAHELIVLMLPGYLDSAGVKWEIELAKSMRIPIRRMHPSEVGL